MNQSVEWEHIYNTKSVFKELRVSMEFLAFMAEKFWGKKGQEFLDLGSGTGGNTLFLAEKEFKVTAIEFSKSACDKLRSSLTEKNQLYVDIINTDVMEVEFPETKFDCILTLGFFECFNLGQSCEIGKKLRKWLKPNGNVLAKVLAQPVPDCIRHENININYYSSEELSHIFAGFNGKLTPITTYTSDFKYPITNWILDLQLQA